MRLFKNTWFNRFARKEGIDDAALLDAVRRISAGMADADLGGGLIKQRLPRRGSGRSGGFRSIVVFRSRDRAIFVYGFAKSDRDNIGRDELLAFRELADQILKLDARNLDKLVENGDLIEVFDA